MLDYPFFKDKSFNIAKAIEYNKAACESYTSNIGNVVENKDVRDVRLDSDSSYGLIIGGVSCKPFSNANRIKRLEEHEDSELTLEYIRLVKESKADIFVLENVPNILKANNSYYLNAIKEELSDFNIKYFLLNDSGMGGFTFRKRAFIIGSKLGEFEINMPKMIPGIVKNALAKVTKNWFNYYDITKPRNNSDITERMSLIPQGGNWKDLPKSLWQPSYNINKTHTNTLRRLEEDKPCITLTNFRKCNIIHPTEDRGLSVAEASALSGFDKDFIYKGTLADRQLQIANGVPYKMAHAIKNIVKDIIFKFKYKKNVVCAF